MHKILLSPAKSIKAIPAPAVSVWTEPRFEPQTSALVNGLQKLSANELKTLYKVSDRIAHLNHERYRDWDIRTDENTPHGAGFQFDGDVYKKLSMTTLDTPAIDYLQEHLCILSGLYGMLRPLDLIQPYRLEMGTKWGIHPNEHIAKYWKPLLTEQMKAEQPNFIVNLASNEYSSAIDKKAFKDQWIDVQFLQFKDGKYKNIGIFAKQARGLMTRFLAQEKIDSRADLSRFNLDHYELSESQSNDSLLTFVR